MNFEKIGNFYINFIANDILLISSNFNSSIKRDTLLHKFLQAKNFSGILYIDSLLTTGTAENRFITAKFQNKIKDINIANSDVANEINSKTTDFFHKNKELLYNSNLTDRQIEIVSQASNLQN